MKKFELPKIEISMFSVEDMITTSAGGGSNDPVSNSLNSGSGGAAGNDILSDSISTYSIGYDAIDMGA